MFKKLIKYFKDEKELMKRTEELHDETERILKEEEERKNNPVFRTEPMRVKFVDSEGNVHWAELFSDESHELLKRKDVRMIFE